MGRIEIISGIDIDEDHLEWEFIRAKGPGGQNVNKVATAVKLRLDLNKCDFPNGMRRRLLTLAGQKVTNEGILIIHARRFRTQQHNRQDALERLTALIQKAAQEPKIRRPTQPSKASQEKVKATKLHRRKIKRLRRSVRSYER